LLHLPPWNYSNRCSFVFYSQRDNYRLKAFVLYAQDKLLAIARSQITQDQQKRHLELLEKNQIDQLTPAQRLELSELRIAGDRLMLQKNNIPYTIARAFIIPMQTETI